MEEDTADSHSESVDEASIAVDRGEMGGAVGVHPKDDDEEEDDEVVVMKEQSDVSLSQLILLLQCLGCMRRGSD